MASNPTTLTSSLYGSLFFLFLTGLGIEKQYYRGWTDWHMIVLLATGVVWLVLFIKAIRANISPEETVLGNSQQNG